MSVQWRERCEAGGRFEAVLGRRWVPIALPEGDDLNDLGRRPGGRSLFFRLIADARRSSSPDVRKDQECTGK